MAGRKSKTTTNSEEETRRYHKRYLRAVNSPLRRKILRALSEGSATFEELQAKTEIDKLAMKWHINVLENGFCIEQCKKQGKLAYRLTQEGKVVDYLE